MCLLFTLVSWFIPFINHKPLKLSSIHWHPKKHVCVLQSSPETTDKHVIEQLSSSNNAPQPHTPLRITFCGRQADAKLYFVIHSLTLPQRWSPYQLLHVALAGIWQRRDEQREAYSHMFCSIWGLVKLSLQMVLRSRPKLIKSVQGPHEYIMELPALHVGVIGWRSFI